MTSIYHFLLIPAFILSGIIPSKGNTYYFSSTNGDDSRTAVQARQATTPWRSLSKLNQIFGQLQPGDSVLFKRGDIFYGVVVAGQSGVAGSPIVLAAYGQGKDPVISGFSKLSGWVSGGNGIWQAPCQGCGLRVNMVTIGDTVQAMGRYPNSGYLRIQSHTGTTAITDDHLAGGPDWTGAEVVIRKNRFTIDKIPIVSQQGNTLTYKKGTYYAPIDKFGYFIQNDIRTLDQPGEWYYDPKLQKMNVYFGASGPTARVSATSADTLVSILNRQFLVFEGLEFQGANNDAFFLSGSANITIDRCRIYFSGVDGIKLVNSSNVTMSNLVVDHSNDNGIDLIGTGNLVTDCRVSHTGTIPGTSIEGHAFVGIQIDGTNNTVQRNTIDTTGYVGVFFWHSNLTTVKNNSIDYFCFVMDDGGGIYTWSGDIDSARKRDAGIIDGNIVLNGITSPGGTDSAHAGIAIGIYLDENTSGVAVSNNTVAHCTMGIFLQDAHEVTVKGNTLYDNGTQIQVRHPLATGVLKNNEISNNTAVAVRNDETLLGFSSALPADVTSFADVHDNHYLRTSGGGPFFIVEVRQDNKNVQTRGQLSDWQTKYGKDTRSDHQALPAVAVRFEYNAGKVAKTVTLDRSYKDPGGKVYQGQVMLAPYTSVILVPNG
jgi:parallel beta-helix repeat protein